MSLKQFFNWAGDEIGNLGTSIDKAITQPVFKVAEDVVQAALSDPIGTIAKVAAIATGNAWALPVISAAQTAAAGGNIGDVVKAAAIAYVAGEAGTAAGSYFSDLTANYLVTTGADAANIALLSNVAQSAATGAISSSITAVAQGQDPIDALIKGGLTAGVASGVSQGIDRLLVDQAGFKFDPTDKTKFAFEKAVKSALVVGAQGGDPLKTFGSELITAAGVAAYDYVKDKIKPDTNALIEANDDYKNKAKELADNYQTQNSAASNYNAYVKPINDAYTEYENQARLWKEYEDGSKWKALVGTYGHNSASQIWNQLYPAQEAKYYESIQKANEAYNTYNPLAENALKQYNDAKAAAPELERIVGVADQNLATAVKTYQQNELINTTIVLDALQEFDDAQFNYKQETGQDLPVETLTAAAKSGDVLSYVDNLYTTEAEAKDIWKATVGTEPTEYDLLGLIGLDTGQVTSQVQGIADDRSTVSSDELDAFLRDIGKGQITLTTEEQMDLLGGSEVAARNAIAGKYNAFVEDKNTTLGSEAEAFWKKAGLDPASMTMDDLAMMLKGNEASAETYAQRLADVRETTFKPVDDFAKQAAVEYAAMKAGYNTYEYGGKTYTVSKDDIAASADGRVLSEYTRIVDGALKANGVDPNTLTEQQRQDLMTAAYRQYGNDINQLRAASAQDFINGNTQTIQQFVDNQSTADFKFVVAGNLPVYAGSSQDLKGYASDYVPASLTFATESQIDSGEATKINLPNGRVAWVVNKPTSEVDLSGITLGSLQGQDPWATDPEAALLTYSQFDTKQLGGAKELVINSAKAAVDLIQNIEAGTGGFVSITPEGKSTLIDVVATTAKAGGNVVKNFSDLIWATGLVERDNVAGATANALIRYSDSILSTDAKTQQDNILKAINSADTLKGKYDALMTASKANPWGAALIAGGEIIEELPTLLAGGAVGKVAAGIWGKSVGFAAARGSDAALSAGESAGVGYAETYDNIIKAGGSAEYAASQAAKSAFQAAAITFGSDLVGDAALVKKFMGDLKDLSVGQLTKVGAKQFVTEGFEEGLQNISTQYNSFGTVDMNQAMNAFTIGSVLGVTTTAGILGPGAINYNAQVALGLNGEGVTLQQVFDGTVQVAPGSFDINAVPITIGGASVSLGDFTKVVDTSISDPNFSLTSYKTNLEGLAQIDYGGSGLSDIAIAVTLAPDANTLTTQLQDMGLSIQQQADVGDTKFDSEFITDAEVKQEFDKFGYPASQDDINQFIGQQNQNELTNKIEQYVDPRQVTEEESRQFYRDLGYEPTLDEVQLWSGQANQAATPALIAEYVNQNTVTEAEARAALKDSGIAEPTQEMINSLVGQYSQTQLATKANEMLTGYMTAEQTNKAVRDAIAGIQFPEGLTTEDVTKAITNYMAANPGLSATDVTNAITSELKKLPAYATPADVTTAIETALAGYATQANVDAATKTLQEAIDAAQAGNTTRFDEIDQAIQDLRDAGLTEDQVKAVVDASAEGLSSQFKDALDAAVAGNTEALGTLKTDLETKIGDVQTALETALGEQGSAFGEQVTALMEQGQSYQEAVNAALQALGTDIGSLGEDVATKLADLGTTLGERLTGLESQLGDVETRLAEAIQTAKDIGLEGDQALEAAINSVAADLGTTKDALLEQIGTTEQALREDFATQLAGVTAELGNVETRLTEAIAAAEASGLSRDEAIETALNQVATDLGTTKEDLLGQLGTVESGLRGEIEASQAALGEQITGVESRLTEAIADAEALGLTRDQAIQAAVDAVAADLGTTREDLLAQLGTTETTLRSDLEAGLGLVSEQVADVEQRLSDAFQDAKDTGLAGDAALQAAIDSVAGDLGTTREDLLSQLGTTEEALRTDFATQLGEVTTELGNVETRLTEAIAAAEAAGLSRDEAIQSAVDEVASDLGTTREALLEQIGATETTLRADLEAGLGLVGEQVAGVEQRLTEAIAEAEAAGLSRDEAIQAAVDAVAADLGTTREGLLAQLGTTEAALRTEFQTGQATLGEQISTGIGGLQTALAEAEARINERAAEYEAAGLSRDQALQTAISDVATQLGTTAQNLEQQLFAAQTALGEQITGVQTGLQQQIQDVATVLGKPAQAVTQADIDLVNQMIQGQVQTDLTYDANRDGVIDQNDIAFLTSITTGTEPPEFPAGTRWAPTGVYGQIAGLGADLTRQLEQQELERIAREQAAAEEAERAAQGRFQQQQQQQRVQQFMGMLTQPGALQQKVQVKAPEVMKLEQLYGGLYDPTAGLFRTPQQQQFFASPYGNYFDGGEVTEDELLAIVRG